MTGRDSLPFHSYEQYMAMRAIFEDLGWMLILCRTLGVALELGVDESNLVLYRIYPAPAREHGPQCQTWHQ